MAISPYINRFLCADTVISSYANPQNLNRFSYVGNNPLRYTDPTGHLPIDGPCGYQGQDCQNGPSTPPTTPSGGCGGDGQPSCGGSSGGSGNGDESQDNPLATMKPGDIITFNININGQTMTYNYILGLMNDGKTLGFWDLDAHRYVAYALAVSLIDSANRLTTFKKTDPKTFNSYQVVNSSGAPFDLPTYNINWTGGTDDEPSFVEVRTEIDSPGLGGAILNIISVQLLWGYGAANNAIDISSTDLVYRPSLASLVVAWQYITDGDYIVERYPIIHP